MIISDLYYTAIRFLVTVILILSFALEGCERKNNYPEVYKYEIPDQLDDGWVTESLRDAGIDQKILYNLMNRICATPQHNIHSILIIKESKLVFEEYFEGEKFKLGKYTGEYGFTGDDLHTLCSATKSFASALTGIAIDKGYIASADLKVFDFFPENSEHIDPNDFSGNFSWSDGYGFQWWQKDYTSSRKAYHSYFASGWGGQLIIVIPEIETVIVFTGGNYFSNEKISCYEIVEEYIIPALQK